MSPERWALTLSAAVALAACANTRGSWSCKADHGLPCQSIAQLDQGDRPAGEKASAPAIEGASAVRWWTANEVAGAFEGAPRREPDQIVRVLVAGWTDAAGDFHAPAEIFAVMRKGGWWAPPPATPLAPPKTARVTAPVTAPAPPRAPTETTTGTPAGGAR